MLNPANLGPFAPAPAVLALLDRFNRDELGHAIEVLIALLDVWDGDPDLEDDDPAGMSDEDGINTGTGSYWTHGQHHQGPGCPISGPGGTYGLDC